MRKLASMFLSLSLINAAACVEIPADTGSVDTIAAAVERGVSIQVRSRVSTASRMLVDYTIDRVAYQLDVSGTPQESAHVVRKGGRTMLTLRGGADGSLTIVTGDGRHVGLAELRADPSLILLVDQGAAATLDPDVFALLTDTQPTAATPAPNPICLATWLALAGCAVLGIGAYIAACVDWSYQDGKWTVTGSC